MNKSFLYNVLLASLFLLAIFVRDTAKLLYYTIFVELRGLEPLTS
jgi:hypothetical protein